MIVLHAVWDHSLSGLLHLWAESSDTATTAPRGKKRSTAVQSRLHPFALAETALQEILGDLAGTLLVKGAVIGSISLRLPSLSKGPLSSPELMTAETDLSGQAVALQPWDVPTLDCDASHALDFLLALPLKPSHGLAFGSSLRFWSQAAQFSFELLTRQRFIPTLHANQDTPSLPSSASWLAVLTSEDQGRFNALAQMMPPVCWSFLIPTDNAAITATSGQSVGSVAFLSQDTGSSSLLQDLLLHFLNATIDAFVRESVPTTALVPASHSSSSTTLPEKWLRALTTPDATFTAPATNLAAFSASLHNWFDQLQSAPADAPFRTCFKLEAPLLNDAGAESADADSWHLSFYLQANDDRSLLIPAEKVWQERSGTLTFLKRKFENPQERLLADLGKSAQLFPLIDESLQSAHPQALALSTEQAYGFLRETAPLLEDSGFGVLIPPWWQKTSARIGVKLQVRPRSPAATSLGIMGLNSIVDYNWSIAVGDTTLTMKEFEQLVNLKQSLVNVRGQWVELRQDEIEKAIAFFQKKRAKQDMSLGDALRFGLGQEQSTLGLPVVGLEAEGWIQDVMDGLHQRVPLTPIEVPSTFHGQLRPYQLKGVSWLAFLKQFGFGACLADDMGLGKTIQLITLLLHERQEQTAGLKPTLLISPMSIVGNWQREIQRFAPSLSVMVHHGLERLSGPAFAEEASKHDVVITTYSLAPRDKVHLAAIEWENIVIDEAQNIKNESAKQTQAIKSLAARHKIALTGTPVENRLSELWSIMEFLNPGYLGSDTDFRKNFALPIERYHNPDSAVLLKNLIQPFVLRRLKTDKAIIQDLPDKLEMKVFCNLTQEQASLYEAVVKEMLEKLESPNLDPMARRGLILATLLKLKQICNHPAQFVGDNSSLPRRSGKLVRLEEMLEEVLATGDKALIFTQFAEMGILLRLYLQERLGYETLFLYGGTPKKQRDLMVQRFQEEHHGPRLFILSLKAGGVGLNLTAANHVFHFDRWWNPAVENQATDRAFRIGQQRNVQVHKFVCVGTLEERIDQMIEQKKDLAERIVGAGENWLTEMSTAQLKEIITLSRDAVGV